MRPPSKANLKGDVRGYDVRTGKLLWTFHTIPDARRAGLRDVARRLGRVHGQRRRLGGDGGGCRSSAIVYLPDEAPLADTLGRRAARQQSL